MVDICLSPSSTLKKGTISVCLETNKTAGLISLCALHQDCDRNDNFANKLGEGGARNNC